MKLRGGIVGCGFFAQFQIDAWRRMPEVELVAAADPDLARAGQAAPKAYASMAEMLDGEKLDFVDIATRPDTHLPLVREAAARGVAIVCQKPLAPTWEEAKEIVRAAAGVPFMVHENWRWQPWFREAAARISRGDIGRPLTYGFRTRKRDGLGAAPYTAQPYFKEMPRLLIHETLIHHIDTARLLFGDVREVYADARRGNPAIAGEDMAYLLLGHESGLLGSIDGNRYTEAGYYKPYPDAPPLGEATFEGEEAMLTVMANGDLLRNGELVWRSPVLGGYRGDSVLATQQHFVRQLQAGGAFETSGPEYLKSVAVVEAAYRSRESGVRVAIGTLF